LVSTRNLSDRIAYSHPEFVYRFNEKFCKKSCKSRDPVFMTINIFIVSIVHFFLVIYVKSLRDSRVASKKSIHQVYSTLISSILRLVLSIKIIMHHIFTETSPGVYVARTSNGIYKSEWV